MRKRMYICMCDWVTLLYSRNLTEYCKPAIMEKIKIIKKINYTSIKKKKAEKNDVPPHVVRQEEVPLYSGFYSGQSSGDWMKPTHIRRATCFTQFDDSNIHLPHSEHPHRHTEEFDQMSRFLGVQSC